MEKNLNSKVCLEDNFKHSFNHYRVWYFNNGHFEAVRITIDGIPQVITKELEKFCKEKITKDSR